MADENQQGFLRDEATGALVVQGPGGAGLGLRYLGGVNKTDANFTTTSTSPVDVTGAAVTVTTTGRPVVIVYGAQNISNNNAAPTLGHLQLSEGAVKIHDILYSDLANNVGQPVYASFVLLDGARIPSAGSHTYKLMADVTGFGAGTLTISRVAESPIYIHVFEI
jgi:hypothetical protein